VDLGKLETRLLESLWRGRPFLADNEQHDNEQQWVQQ
jgi:hypothetical protein